MPHFLRMHLNALATDIANTARATGFDGDASMRTLLARLPVAALLADDYGRYVVVNDAASTLTGYSTAELQRLSVWDLTPMGNQHEAESLWRAFLAVGDQSGEYDLIRKDGQSVRTAYLARAHILPSRHISLLGEPQAERRTK